MPWQVLRLQVPATESANVELALLEAGALSVTLADARDQPLFQLEPGAEPLWDDVTVCGMFDGGVDLAPLAATLADRFAHRDGAACRIERLPDQDWERAWMSDFRPLRFGRKLWICPSWLSPPDPSATNMMLDPGLAFGTGTHPTTALCLEWLDGHDVRGKVVVDYGCGSGILAIAAALLGASRVLAIDNDPQALAATATNRDRNQIDAAALSCHAPGDFPRQHPPLPAAILLANILAGPLHDLATTFSELVQPGGWLVLSGILPEQAQDLLGTYGKWFDMEPPVTRDGWVRLSGTRRYSGKDAKP